MLKTDRLTKLPHRKISHRARDRSVYCCLQRSTHYFSELHQTQSTLPTPTTSRFDKPSHTFSLDFFITRLARARNKMSDSLEAQNGGPLLALPSELRLLINEMILPPCRIDICNQWRRPRRSAILTTCQTIRTEALPVLYDNTEFSERFWCDTKIIKHWMSDSEDNRRNYLNSRYKYARPHITWLRKLHLEITLVDSDSWEKPEDKDRWFRDFEVRLDLMSKAPHLSKVHARLEVKVGCSKVMADVNRTISTISRYMNHAAVKIEIGPSLRATDFQPSCYYDTLVKLNWLVQSHHRHSIEQKLIRSVSKARKRCTQRSSQTSETNDTKLCARSEAGQHGQRPRVPSTATS